MGYYAKLMERKKVVVEERFVEKRITERELRNGLLKILRPNYSAQKMLSAFDEIEGLK